jgi:hypothetical protein
MADELLAPNSINLAMGGADLAGVKAMTAAMHGALKEDLVAEGNAVFARFNYVLTLPDGRTSEA